MDRWRPQRAGLRGLPELGAWGFISVSLVVWVIWALTSGVDSFPWPVFVSLAAGLNVLRTLVMRGDIIAEETRRLEKKQRRQLPGGDG